MRNGNLGVSEIRNVLDPDDSLPEVQFRPTPYEFVEILDSDGNVLGDFTPVIEDGHMHFATLDLKDDEAIRVKGYGSAAYLKAIEEAHERGLAFETHPKVVSEKARAVWNRFIRAGIADEIEPFKVLMQTNADGQERPTLRDGLPQYSGLYRISPSEPTTDIQAK
jgi:hypothetical protein